MSEKFFLELDENLLNIVIKIILSFHKLLLDRKLTGLRVPFMQQMIHALKKKTVRKILNVSIHINRVVKT